VRRDVGCEVWSGEHEPVGEVFRPSGRACRDLPRPRRHDHPDLNRYVHASVSLKTRRGWHSGRPSGGETV